ncbi:hypothetical protein, partial [Clostridium sp. HCS.1]|uniref:hypothetical protein n=1 Tax=Clostridium sp. HCS.1 TaxID=3238594 RepID=UPI003A0FE722
FLKFSDISSLLISLFKLLLILSKSEVKLLFLKILIIVSKTKINIIKILFLKNLKIEHHPF